MRQRFQPLFCALVFPLILLPQDSPANLPIKRVVLYKNGIGYFEHLEQVRNNQDVTVSFTSGQLNDVLKSLTVLDLTGGRIAGVAYGSSAPIDRQLGDLRIPTGDKTSLSDFLGALRGARLEVRNGPNVITGRLLSVERKSRISGGTTLEIDYLSLITDTGELHTTEISPAFSVKLLETGLAGKVGRFLDLVSSEREPDTRRMVISTAGSGERNLFVSYISETPVWKTTYRIDLLDSKAGSKPPLLQGLGESSDSTVGQELGECRTCPWWPKTRRSLSSRISRNPYYTQRPGHSSSRSRIRAPQTYESDPDPGRRAIDRRRNRPERRGDCRREGVKAYDANSSLVGAATTDAAGMYELRALPEGPIRLSATALRVFNTTAIAGLTAPAARSRSPGRTPAIWGPRRRRSKSLPRRRSRKARIPP